MCDRIQSDHEAGSLFRRHLRWRTFLTKRRSWMGSWCHTSSQSGSRGASSFPQAFALEITASRSSGSLRHCNEKRTLVGRKGDHSTAAHEAAPPAGLPMWIPEKRLFGHPLSRCRAKRSPSISRRDSKVVPTDHDAPHATAAFLIRRGKR